MDATTIRVGEELRDRRPSSWRPSFSAEAAEVGPWIRRMIAG
jgi:hypothetical protein